MNSFYAQERDSDTPRSFVYTNKELEVLNDPRSFLKLGKEKLAQVTDDNEAEAVAAELVRREIVEKRLGGSDLGYKRWASQNRSYLAYRVGLKKAEVVGQVDNVTDTDDAIAKHSSNIGWTVHGATYISPDGHAYGRLSAVKHGYTGKE